MSEKTLGALTKDERSLLLYLETCATDHGGLVDRRRMNEEDVAIVERWDKEGFLAFGRICFDDIKTLAKSCGPKRYTHWCELSDKAWKSAHVERRARSHRIMSKRTWKKTSEVS